MTECYGRVMPNGWAVPTAFDRTAVCNAVHTIVTRLVPLAVSVNVGPPPVGTAVTTTDVGVAATTGVSVPANTVTFPCPFVVAVVTTTGATCLFDCTEKV